MTNRAAIVRKDVERILELNKLKGDDCSVLAQFTCDIPMHERDHVLEFYKKAPVMADMIQALLSDMDVAIGALGNINNIDTRMKDGTSGTIHSTYNGFKLSQAIAKQALAQIGRWSHGKS